MRLSPGPSQQEIACRDRMLGEGREGQPHVQMIYHAQSVHIKTHHDEALWTMLSLAHAISFRLLLIHLLLYNRNTGVYFH